MIVLGLTGSIGMGKTTTARLFALAGVPVHDSDAAVHVLYSGPAGREINREFPGVLRNNIVDRSLLAARVIGNAAAMARLEAIVHPLVAESRARFLRETRRIGARIVVLDIPLLFEIGGQDSFDAIVVVSVAAEEQARRVLARPGMTAEKFTEILARQVPDTEKRRRAHFIIDTSRGSEDARRQVDGVLRAVASTDFENGEEIR